MHSASFTPEDLQRLRAEAASGRLSARTAERLGWILFYAEHRCSITATCERFGITRGTFRRWMRRFDPANVRTLEERSHVPLRLRCPLVPAEVVALIRAYRERDPHVGKEQIVQLLQIEHGKTVSASSVGRVIERECLYFGLTPLHWRKRWQRHHGDEQAEPLSLRETVIQHEEHDCFWCRVKACPWRRVGRSFAVASLVTNLLFAGAVAVTLLQEKQRARNGTTEVTQATTVLSIDDQTGHAAAPDGPDSSVLQP